MAQYPRCRVASWADIDRWADAIAAQVDRAGRRPQTIVGLTRGGWVAARLLADRLAVRRLVAVRAQHWGVTATPTGSAQLTEPLSGDVAGERVLVVDDITDTGESLELAAAHIAQRRPDRLESATLLHITRAKYAPTYFGEEIPRDAWVWVVFPWNVWEDLATLGRQALDEAGSPRAARRLLTERCGWTVTEADLVRATTPPPAPSTTAASRRRAPRSGS